MEEWRGIPRVEIPWFPSIEVGKCIGCRACVEFCPNNVLVFDGTTCKAQVANPYNCVVECQACAKLCPTCAISFPDESEFSRFIQKFLTDKQVS